jgi:soluble lytic murein transglycosylase
MRICFPRPARWAIAVLFCAGIAPAYAQDVLSLVRAGNWPAADAAVAQEADPVARKLVLFYRLETPNAASLDELTAFLDSSPDWPQRALLTRRRDEALAAEPDTAAVIRVCDHNSPAIAAAALLRCADADAQAGRADAAVAAARRAWIDGPSDPAWETTVAQRWAAGIRPEDQLRRFDRLAAVDVPGARRQFLRLDAADRPVAAARLALKTDDATAATLLAALTPTQRSDPAIMLETARWLRRTGRDDEALALWSGSGTAAEQAVREDRRAAFWDERNILARRRLHSGDNQGAFALASAHAPYASEQRADAAFLAGFIALRRLGDPAGAARRFATLTQDFKAALTVSRGYFWLGRADAAAGDQVAARVAYQHAAAYPSTFYGQLAAVVLGDGAALPARIRAQADPSADTAEVVAFAGRELARAAALLVAWGDPRRAAPFLLRLNDVAPDAVDRALDGKLAAGFALPDVAVWIARRAGRDGTVLIETGWPDAVTVPPDAGVDPALALGIVRQESSFDPSTVSPVGARGLMQLMPGTATETARQLRLPVVLPALLTDPSYNLQLGTTYLRKLLDRYDGSVPLAVAAYNAGPTRVADWIGASGDPRASGADVVDWLELIPIGETRNYVQRVIENTVIYRAKLSETEDHPLAQWLR